MSKRKKTQMSENQELSISKAKKTHKRKSHKARDSDLEKPADASDSNDILSKATVAEAVQECREHSLDNTEMEILPTHLDSSLAEESKEASSERKGCVKSFVPPSQGGKLVPMFAKTKNKVPERCEGNDGSSSAIQMKQIVLESSEAECMVRNAPRDTAGKAFQSTAALSESLELIDLPATNKEDTGDQGILHCEETLDTKIQNQDRIISINNGDAIPRFMDSQLEVAQKPTNISAPCATAGKAFQSTVAPSESVELMDLPVTKKEDLRDQGILHCEETPDVKIQNQDRIININSGDAVPGFMDSQLEEAQKPTNILANISEKQMMKSKKRVSFFLCTSDNKDIESLEERALSGSSGHVKNSQNEDALEGPTLQSANGTKNKCEKLVPIIKKSKFDTCDPRPNEISETLSERDADQQTDEKEKPVMCEENKLACVEGCFSSTEISQLDRAVLRSESSRENSGSEAQGSLLSGDKGSSTSAPNSPDTVAQRCSVLQDPNSVGLDFLLDSQLQDVFESDSLDHLSHKVIQ
ncbi:uncharacterized protein LOC132581292 [Heteronotia binoei]|uniref:uncharacterized protein LOC132581292 n=1 Tax=Heteronotia binoei TaxID=13085 RepID=UPI0029303C01|nr:uncharacterized protein LOC132581292 [Heteronotia binoei]